MVVDERARHALHTRLERALGPEEATTLMSLLPPVGWADVATKHDLDVLGAKLTAELRGELHGEIGGLRGELHGEIGGLRGELYKAMAAQTRTLMIGMITTMVTMTGLAFAAAQLT